MNGLAIAFVSLNGIAMIALSRRWACLPLLIAACYMTYGQGIEVGPFTFSVVRLIILAGVVRILVNGERPIGKLNSLDWLMIFWSIWAVLSSLGHKSPWDAFVFRLGEVYDYAGLYFLFRILVQSNEDIIFLFQIIAIVLAPVALEMVNEKITGNNLFSVFGGVHENPAVREGKIRAQGPFMHAILAGTVGAVCLPLMAALWQGNRKIAMIGLGASCTIVWACASSGPIMSAAAAVFALYLWRFRQHMRLFRCLAVVFYLLLELVMIDPAYYIMARIDISGGSTGWHRAELIHSAFQHLDEWWFMGTDYTIHWMPTGVSWSPDHTDITNQYLKMGVIGGLPLMLLTIAMLVRGFWIVGDALRRSQDLPGASQFMLWTIGASLFAQAATGVSVSYFDQSFLFLYLTLAMAGSIASITLQAAALDAGGLQVRSDSPTQTSGYSHSQHGGFCLRPDVNSCSTKSA